MQAEHDGKRAGKLDRRHQQVLRPVVEQLGHVAQVVGEHRHQPAGTVAGVEPERERFIMPEQFLAHRLFHLGAHRVAEIGVDHVAGHLHRRQRRQQQRGRQQLLRRARAPLRQHRAGHIPGHKRDQQRAARAQQRKKQVRQKDAAVRAVIRKEFLEPWFCKLRCHRSSVSWRRAVSLQQNDPPKSGFRFVHGSFHVRFSFLKNSGKPPSGRPASTIAHIRAASNPCGARVPGCDCFFDIM